MPPTQARASIALATTLACASVLAQERLPEVTVHGNYLNAVGSSDAASQGSVTAKLIENRPTLRPAEVLEFVPGVIVTQHSGDGKANQYFLRGFNLDHGTDFATFVDGMPANMPTHAHGHGYTDLNWLIPELVERIDYKKGPYFADEGDFASAGAAHIRSFRRLPQGIGSATVGAWGYRRGLVANSSLLGDGSLLYALEGARNDGPWEHPEKLHRLNAVVRYAFGDAANRSSLTAMAYDAGWNATDQVPLRALEQGLIGRFGSLDPSDGGNTSRASLSYQLESKRDDGTLKLDAYAIRSRLDLFSNFGFFLANPVDGDQFQQSERRQVFGGALSRQWDGSLFGHDATHTLGVQLRHDRLDPVSLSSTVARQRLDPATSKESTVRQTSVGLYAQSAVQWTPWLRSIAGLRTDRFAFKVAASDPADSGTASAGITSPKLSLVLGPWSKSELFVNWGRGFHSNDARGTTAAVQPVDALVRSRGEELGLRTEIVPGLQSSLALWRLRLASELLFVGDAGATEAHRASRRHGIEWNNHWVLRPWLLVDADLALSKARFDDGDPDGVGTRIPGAIEKVASVGVTVTELGPWFGQLQLRCFGPRPLVEDNSRRSEATTLAYLRAGYRIDSRLKLALDVFNLFDRRASDIDYFYPSRLGAEGPQGVEDIHFHPVEPRSVRLTLMASF
ncbi:MAG TPA: TonB-dependent receptor [Albitalea sp.]|uniref:TonB-dependent receptor n=1 Tax=Piscinibacter sp. TaxID=1903157 RepID=UPI002ED3EAA7